MGVLSVVGHIRQKENRLSRARGEESSHLPNRKASVDFIELITDKAQVFFHS